MYQRSADAFLGVPFNIASYALLTHIIARECNLEVGDYVHTIGDAHIYLNHIDQVKEQLTRDEYSLPALEISNDFILSDGLNHEFELDTVNMFTLKNYQYHPTIKAPMAV
jgi:thymidylate synthase